MKNQECNGAPGADGLEERLRRQPLKEIPAAWRAEVMAATRAAASTMHGSHASPSALQLLWQRFFWPHPKAWAALAAVWLLIVGLNLSSREPGTVARVDSEPPSALEARELTKQKMLLAELIGQPATRDAEPPKTVLPRPHSQRRDEFITV